MSKENIEGERYPHHIVVSTKEGTVSGECFIAVANRRAMICPVIESAENQADNPWRQVSGTVRFGSVDELSTSLDAWREADPRDRDDRVIPFPKGYF